MNILNLIKSAIFITLSSYCVLSLAQSTQPYGSAQSTPNGVTIPQTNSSAKAAINNQEQTQSDITPQQDPQGVTAPHPSGTAETAPRDISQPQTGNKDMLQTQPSGVTQPQAGGAVLETK